MEAVKPKSKLKKKPTGRRVCVYKSERDRERERQTERERERERDSQ